MSSTPTVLVNRFRAGGWKADGPLLAGVAARLARRAGASVLVVRVGFVVTALAAGWGVVAYLLAFVLLAGRREPAPRPVTLRHNLGVMCATAMQVALAQAFATGVQGNLLWPAALVGFALALTEPTPDTAGPVVHSRSGDLARYGAGLVLMVSGLLAAAASSQSVSAMVGTLPGVGVLLGGLALVAAPWARDLMAAAEGDRAERARAEARADMAAHLHDSVLQTLTLIQNRAGEPAVAAALAHQQERELRRWLYGVGQDDAADRSTFRAAMEQAAAEVEDQYLRIVECIVVGDAPIDDDLSALVGAAREAMVNASKFADTSLISVYAEVTADPSRSGQAVRVEVYVRDRGVGFDLALVPADRHGISDSIRARVERAGGRADVRSRPGEGTEVAIRWTR